MDEDGGSGVAVGEGEEGLIGGGVGLGHVGEGGKKEHDGDTMLKHEADYQTFTFVFSVCGEQISKMLLLARSEYNSSVISYQKNKITHLNKFLAPPVAFNPHYDTIWGELYFSPRRGSSRVLKFCLRYSVNKIIRLHS